MQNLKEIYNQTLQRYYNGCNYIEQHIEELDKYLPVVQQLLSKLNLIIEEIGNMTEQEILEGFNIE